MGNSDAFHFSFSVVVRERVSLPCLSQQGQVRLTLRVPMNCPIRLYVSRSDLRTLKNGHFETVLFSPSGAAALNFSEKAKTGRNARP